MRYDDILRNYIINKSAVSLSEIKRVLIRKVPHNKLKIILRELNMKNKIAIGPRGFTWIYNSNPNLRETIKKGFDLK